MSDRSSILRRALHRTFWSVALIVTCLYITSYVYFGVHYATSGLGGIPREDYVAALDRVAQGYAFSEGMTCGPRGEVKVREVEPGGEAYAWCVSPLLTDKGETVLLWVSLKWKKNGGRWRRYRCYILGDPRNRMYYAESLIAVGTLERLDIMTEDLSRELGRRHRELRGFEAP